MKKITNNKKAGLSLTTSYIVIIIIVMVLIGIAINIVYIGLNSANRGKEYIDSSHKKQIEEYYKLSNSNTFFPYNRHILNSGGTHTFAIGIKNNLGKNAIFKIQLTYDGAEDLAGDKIIDPDNIYEWYFSEPIEVDLEANKHEVVGLTIKAKNARLGIYKFNVLVTCEENSCDPYYDVKSLILNVE